MNKLIVGLRTVLGLWVLNLALYVFPNDLRIALARTLEPLLRDWTQAVEGELRAGK